MANYSFVQPNASTNFVLNTTGTSSSDQYRISLNPIAGVHPFGTWIINDTSNSDNPDRFILDLLVTDPQRVFDGPRPGPVQYFDSGKFLWSFHDGRLIPLKIELNGFDYNRDQVFAEVRTPQGLEILDFNPPGTGSVGVSTTKTATANGQLHDFFYSYDPSVEDDWSMWNFDISAVNQSSVAEIRSLLGGLREATDYELYIFKDAFKGNVSNPSPILSLPDSLSNDFRYDVYLSAAAANNQVIQLDKQIHGDWKGDTINYSVRGLQANGQFGYVSDVSQLSERLEFHYSAGEGLVYRSLQSNPGDEYVDRFVGFDTFSLSNLSDEAVVDVGYYWAETAREESNWGFDFRSLRLEMLGGNDTISFVRNDENQALYGGDNSSYRYSRLGSVFIEGGDIWNQDLEKNAIFVNLTGEAQIARNSLTKQNVQLNSSLAGNQATGQMFDVHGSIDQIVFNQNAQIYQLGFDGSNHSDRFYLGDEGLNGSIENYMLVASRGNDVYRITNEAIQNANQTSSLYLYYANFSDVIQDSSLVPIDPIGVKYYSGVVQKGERGIYGIDRVQREVGAALIDEQYEFTKNNDYVELAVRQDSEKIEFKLGNGSDRVYVKPFLDDGNSTILINLDDYGNYSSSSTSDVVEIDFRSILDQALEQNSNTLTTIRISHLGSNDQIRFVNPGNQMAHTAYDDGNFNTGNDAQLGWTFSKVVGVGDAAKTHKVDVLLENFQVNAENANTLTVASRTVFDYPTYAMTAGVDNAILFEDSGHTSFYNFLAGDDFVILRDGNLDVVLGAGNDFAAVSGNVGEAIVIGGTGNDTVGLYGLVGANSDESDWVFTTMSVETARATFASKYALNPALNPFEIELSLSGLEVVTVAQRFEGGTRWSVADKKYTGMGDVLQTVYFQAETVSTVNNGDISVDTLYGSRDYSTGVTTAGNFNYYGRRGTEDSLTITLADGNALAAAMSNINSWFVTSTSAEWTLSGSVLSGSHVTTINPYFMDGGLGGGVWATYNLVDIEKITLRGGAEEITIRLAGSNGYASVAEAVNAADYKDVIFVAKTIETPSANPNLMGSIANQTTIDIPAGLGVVFEPVFTSNAFKVNITDQMVADAPMHADRLVYLLGSQNIDVNGSVLADMIIGNQGNNVIYGGGGDDVMYGGGGNDTLFGQAGNDLLVGSVGNDFLNGGTGDDTLITYGTKRIWTTVFDSTNMIGGSGHDEFIFLGGKGNHVMYGGSGEDSYAILPGWESGLSRSGTTFDRQVVNGAATVLDYSTTSDSIFGKDLAGTPESYLSSMNLTFNQLVSPPRSLASSYNEVTFDNGATMQANADAFIINTQTQTTLGSLLEDYGLMNDVTEYRLHQAA